MKNTGLGKTPIKYSGLKPDLDENFLSYWTKWTDEEKLEYVRYLERDTYMHAFTIFSLIIFFVILLILFWIYETPID